MSYAADKKMKVFDCFLFFNELDLLEKRLELLYDVVDYFVIGESRTTFSGLKKPLFFLENQGRFEKFKAKVIHYIIPDSKKDVENRVIEKYFTDKTKSFQHKHNGRPVAKLRSSIQTEIFQRDCLVIPLIDLAEKTDIVLLSDLDEIPTPNEIILLKQHFDALIIYHFKQKWYSYWINNLVESEWFGTRAFAFSSLYEYSMDYHRYPTESRTQQTGIIIENGGWHFSYLGGEEAIKLKLRSLAYQGFRAHITTIMMNIFPDYIKVIINRDGDVLRKGRKFVEVNIDNTFPENVRSDPGFINKYSI